MDAADRLAEALADEPVSAAYLFGSLSEGRQGPLSDVDVGLLPEPGLTGEQRLRLKLRLSAVAADAAGVERADVVLLDEAPPALAFEAIRGRLLLDRDRDRRVRAEAQILSAYHDRRWHDARWAEMTRERYRRGDVA